MNGHLGRQDSARVQLEGLVSMETGSEPNFPNQIHSCPQPPIHSQSHPPIIHTGLSTSKRFLITRQDLGLVFVATTGPSASGTLELPAFGAHIRFGVAVRSSRGLAEMPVHLSALARTREQDTATALGGVQGRLAEGEDLAPGLEDAALGTGAYMKCASVW